MTGGGGGGKTRPPPDPAPAALPIPGREEDIAKKKVKRGAGRFANILAGRLMTQQSGGLQNLLGGP